MSLTEEDVEHLGGALLHLSSGELTVEIAPEIGGSVASFRMRNLEGVFDLMRPLSKAGRQSCDPASTAMFPMLPYANRIANNRFDFGGHTYEFAPNSFGQPLNLHGTGWLSPWSVVTAESDAAELTLHYLKPGEPYGYSASQRFKVTSDRLRVEIELRNLGHRAMPFGFGLHPWFYRHPDTQLRFEATHFWLENPEYLATDQISITPELDFSRSCVLPRTWRNNCYSGWNGIAEILFPHSEFGLRIEADKIFGHIMLYCDPGQSVFCLEPQTHATGALNRLGQEATVDQGLVILQPEEAIAGAVSFIIFQTG